MTRFRLGHYLKTSLWFIPLLFVLAGIIISLVTTSIDRGGLIPQSVTGDPTAALQILYLIAFSMLTLTGLVLSLVVVVVQLAMGVFSPRIVRQILQDRPSQAAIGLFAGTFAHAVLSIRAVKTTGGGSVPGLAVIVAIVLALGCIATLVWYINHIGQSLRVAALVAWVAKDTVKTLDAMYPERGGDSEQDADLVLAPGAGVIFKVDHARLVDLAARADCCLELRWSVGDFVPTGAALLHIVGSPANFPHKDAIKAIAMGPERTLNQDVAYGIRMLVDIAESSLAAGPFDDPTTAVQAIDRLHDVLRQLAPRSLHSGRYHDGTGALRLLAPTMRWEGYVHLAFDEIRQAGAGSPQVTRRLTAALDDLLTVAPPERRFALQAQLALLDTGVVATTNNDIDRHDALVADPSGIGSAAELVTPSRAVSDN